MYTVSKFAKKLGVSVHTLQRWDREGKLVAKRTHTGRRYYTDDDLEKVLGTPPAAKGRVIAYCRVSSNSQKVELVNQRQVLELFCAENGIEVDEWVEEIGGGLNLRRKKFVMVIDAILKGEVEKLVVAHKDRLARFGYEFIRYLCEREKCELIVMDNASLSPEEEMVQDLMTIVHTFSSRLYGLRNYRKTLQKALEDDTRPPNSSQSNG